MDLIAKLNPEILKLRKVNYTLVGNQLVVEYVSNISANGKWTKVFDVPPNLTNTDFYLIYIIETDEAIFTISEPRVAIYGTTITVNRIKYDIDKVLILQIKASLTNTISTQPQTNNTIPTVNELKSEVYITRAPITSTGTTLASTQSVSGALQTHVSEIRSQIADVVAVISRLKSDIIDTRVVINDVVSDLASIQTDVDSLKAQVLEIQSHVNSIATTTNKLESDFVNIRYIVNNVVSSLASAQSEVDSLRVRDYEIQSQIDNIATVINKLESSLVNIQEIVSSIVSTLAITQSTVDTHQTHLSEIQSQIDAIVATVNRQESSIAGIQEAIDNINSALTTVQNDVYVLQTRISDIASLTDALQTDLINLSSRIGYLDSLSRLTAAEYSVGYTVYARLIVANEFPLDPKHNDLVWREDKLKLYRFDVVANNWIEVNWKWIVQSSPEYHMERLRINSNTGKLEISPDGSNWYECIPAVGANVIELLTIDNTSYSYKYWIAPGQTVIIRNANHFPVIMPNPSSFDIRARCQASIPSNSWLVFPSDTPTLTYFSQVYVDIYSRPGALVSVYPGHRIGWIGSDGMTAFTQFSLQRNDSYIESNGNSRYHFLNYGLECFSNHCTNIPHAYWLGTSRNELNGNPLQTFEFAVITRMS